MANSLLYVNSDLDPTIVYRLDPSTGSVLSTESASGNVVDGLGFGQLGGTVVLFSQDFESGLGSNESVFGAFSINSSNFPLNNGTQMMGHAGTYGNNEYSYYEVAIDLTSATSNALLQFDYAANVEGHFDRINVQASTSPIVPPGDLITPISGLPYDDEGDIHRPELGRIALRRQWRVFNRCSRF